ncbi:hypothetical protein HBH98_038450 [Parastagonospora nodorum]|nr:hypothetical protein HBH50_150500 [Parastagonospora nodorum]KAH4089623.1 hypothetical protein HBH48_115600 [Parastagonospora nodorum]KAH4231820.1 hypothetical protein HBI06_072880 [Parastagonospora nodorum]KAH4245731.1 hypothetical protein HBI05_056090 [Parastagonospora nodorum]KAH4350865.1 hypothetical protein HBH98_038450 [Parastagonospora nodorum]
MSYSKTSISSHFLARISSPSLRQTDVSKSNCNFFFSQTLKRGSTHMHRHRQITDACTRNDSPLGKIDVFFAPRLLHGKEALMLFQIAETADIRLTSAQPQPPTKCWKFGGFQQP